MPHNRWRTVLMAVPALLCLAACDRAPTHAELRDVELPRLVPAREFVFNDERHSGFSFSAAAKAGEAGSATIWVMP